MKVKKFIAPSMPEVMKKIRAELGSDAVILNSKMVEKGGFFGLFTKKNFEVIAALDTNARSQSSQHSSVSSNTIRNVNQKKSESVQPKNESHILKEITELKGLIGKISNGVNSSVGHFPNPLKEVDALLMQKGVGEWLRKDLLDALLEKWFLNGANAKNEEVVQWLKEFIFNKLSSYEFGGISYQKKYINVVGPTGVGKTTTLAKIAAECVLKDRKKVGFITTDTYRIAAIEQLKTYAKILGIPIEVCYNVEDFKVAKEKFAQYDLVLVDTAGRNFRNKQYVQDLNEILDFTEEMETYLVLSMTSKDLDMKEIYDQFSSIKINKFIFTKVDETSNCGAILNMIFSSHVGVAYLTNGQNVPDDIFKATPEAIVNTVLGVDSR